MLKRPETDKQKKYCELRLEGVPQGKAALEAGYAKSSASVSAHEMEKRYEEFMFQENVARLKGHASVAIATLARLIQKAKHDSVKLKAATTLLQYAGMKPAEKSEVTLDAKSDEEIDAALKLLMKAYSK